jgi:imidazole glycerol-phosphate synthase subunit HisH
LPLQKDCKPMPSRFKYVWRKRRIKMIAIIDYGMGNLHSLHHALRRMNYAYTITADPVQIKQASGIILPGVGAFGDAMQELEQRNLKVVLQQEAQKGKPLLGICLGMQLLFTSSEEHGIHPGLALLPGHVVRFQGVKPIPHMGWNWLHFRQPHPLLHDLEENYVYFVHSYYVQTRCTTDVIATTDYGPYPVPAIIAKENMIGMQFHPEKSGLFGLQLLERFARRTQAKVGVLDGF